MSDRPYLLNILGLSIVPRVVTSVMTMVSLPLMLRAVGATEFGLIVYVGAIIAVLESFVDGGVSSAAGKAVAVARETRQGSLRAEIMGWVRLQATVAAVGLLPLLGLSYLAASTAPRIGLSVTLLFLLVLAAWLTIALNFVRAVLRSLLAFSTVAVLDTLESIFRSGAWILVAWLMPSALGLAIGGLATATCLSTLGPILLWQLLRKADANRQSGEHTDAVAPVSSTRSMLRDSLEFLFLRVATRMFQAVPLVVFGRTFGTEVVGVVGAMAKLNEIVSFPFVIIGNALAVRAPGIVANGLVATGALWDAVSRFGAGALLLTMTVYFASESVTRLLLPDSQNAVPLVAILSFTLLTTSAAALIVPMSDYVGALRRRNLLMVCCAVGQVPVIWLGAKLGAKGATAAYVLVLVFMTSGYLRIALKAFFQEAAYHVPSEVRYFARVLALACVVAAVGGRWLLPDRVFLTPSLDVTVLSVSLLWITVLAGVMLDGRARGFFISRQFLTFTPKPSLGLPPR